MEHEGDESQPVEAGESGGNPFKILGQTAEAARPCEGALHDPAFGQQHKALFGRVEFDHHQLYTLLSCLLCGACPVQP